MGVEPALSPGSSWNGAWNRSQEGAQAGLLDSYLPSCTQDQKQGRGPSSGQDAGLPWPQSRTGAQRAPNPGDVKLAAGKSSIQAASLPWAPVPSLLGCQATRMPNFGALSGIWGSSWLPPPNGREEAPETSHEVGQGRQRVNVGITRVHWTRATCLGF